MEYVVSYFPNVTGKKVCDMPLSEVFSRIREGAVKSHIEAIRRESNVTKREMLKRQTPAITLSGIFRENHAMKDFQTHSGLVQVDFDKLDSPDMAKALLVKDKYTFGCFISPSGTGVKAIVKIPSDRDLHEKSFEDLTRYYLATYGFKMDRKCKDISRLCFLSYDPELFVNHQSLLFEPEPAQPRNHFNSSPFPTTDELETEVERIVSLIESDKLDITRDYDTWLKLGFALANGFGKNGLSFYKRISQFYHGYSDADCEKQFHACLHGNRHGITIKTFFQIAKDYGIKIGKNPSIQTKTTSAISALEEKAIYNIRDLKPEIFYTPVYGKDNDGNSVISDVRINYRKFIDLLYSWGFRRFDMDKQFFFVHVEKTAKLTTSRRSKMTTPWSE